jgi:hypothetical protein
MVSVFTDFFMFTQIYLTRLLAIDYECRTKKEKYRVLSFSTKSAKSETASYWFPCSWGINTPSESAIVIFNTYFCSSIPYVGVAQCEVVVYWMRLGEVIR